MTILCVFTQKNAFLDIRACCCSFTQHVIHESFVITIIYRHKSIINDTVLSTAWQTICRNQIFIASILISICGFIKSSIFVLYIDIESFLVTLRSVIYLIPLLRFLFLFFLNPTLYLKAFLNFFGLLMNLFSTFLFLCFLVIINLLKM